MPSITTAHATGQSKGVQGSSKSDAASSRYAGAPSDMDGKASSMLAEEMRAIERIKLKQKKEIEQMIDYEMNLQAIK